MRRRTRERIEYLERQIDRQIEYNMFQVSVNKEHRASLAHQLEINANLIDAMAILAERVEFLEWVTPVQAPVPKPIPMDDEAGLE